MKPGGQDLPRNFDHWYAVSGIVVGSLVLVIGFSACAYRCYRKGAFGTPSGDQSTKRRGKKTRDTSVQRNSVISVKSSASSKSLCSFSGPKNITNVELGVPQQDVERGSSNSSETVISTKCRIETIEKPTDSSPTRELIKPPESFQLGKLYFCARYDQPKAALVVTIVQAVQLPPKDADGTTSDPYVKLQLLPEKRQKVKTRVVRKTLHPVYDETFTFYGIDVNQLHETTLHFIVLSFDRFSRDDVIGEVVYPLADAEIGIEEVALCREIAPRHIKIHSEGRGELLVSLCYQPATNRLSVVVLKARNLPKMDVTGLSDPYVRVYVLYNGQRVAKKKTHVKRRSLNPVFNESFVFDVPCSDGLQHVSLQFLILDWDRMTKNEIIGKVEIGARVGLGNGEVQHWRQVMGCPRKQVAEWHRLTD